MRERERESACARARGEDPVRDRELQLQSEIASSNSSPRSRSRRRSRSSRERRDRDLGSQSRRDRRTGNISGIDDFFFPGLWLVFSDLCFPSSFPNTRKYFSENFLKCNQTHGNIFLFRKLAFSKNMYFPENVLQQPNTA